MTCKSGFTLIELLVVAAIILILAAIALPNFLEAVTRSRIAQARSDQRTLATALESYFTDHKGYPEDYAEIQMAGGFGLGRLTSPTAYLNAIPADAFGGYVDTENGKNIISYTLGSEPDEKPDRWILTSAGPNGADETSPAFEYPGYSPYLFENPVSGYSYFRYSPTNGTKSVGDIIRVSDAQMIE